MFCHPSNHSLYGVVMNGEPAVIYLIDLTDGTCIRALDKCLEFVANKRSYALSALWLNTISHRLTPAVKETKQVCNGVMK
jgi:hypothetical protein